MEHELLDDRVLIKTIEETVTAGGIYIPENSKEKPKRGEVVLVGPGTDKVIMTVKPGNIVLFGEYSGIEVDLEEGKFLLMRQEDIFMKIQNKK